jgi:hypothetical protein
LEKNRLLILGGAIILIIAAALTIPILFTEGSDRGEDVVRREPTPTALPRVIQEIARTTPQVFAPDVCTSPPEYWLEKPETWPEQVSLGNVLYTRQEMVEIFRLEAPEPAHILMRSMYITLLNALNGTDITVITETLEDANLWLVDNPPGSLLSDFNRRRAVDLSTVLDGYIRGDYGPGACPTLSARQVVLPTRGEALPQTGLSTPTLAATAVVPAQPVNTPLPPAATAPPPQPTATSPLPLPTATVPLPTAAIPPLPTATAPLPTPTSSAAAYRHRPAAHADHPAPADGDTTTSAYRDPPTAADGNPPTTAYRDPPPAFTNPRQRGRKRALHILYRRSHHQRKPARSLRRFLHSERHPHHRQPGGRQRGILKCQQYYG